MLPHADLGQMNSSTKDSIAKKMLYRFAETQILNSQIWIFPAQAEDMTFVYLHLKGNP